MRDLLIIVQLILLVWLRSVLAAYFPSVNFTVYRGDRALVTLFTDNINYETEATEIVLENQTVDAVVTGSFRNLTKLQYLRLVNDRIRLVERGAFSALPRLRTLNLNFNLLREITEGVFEGLDMVKLSLVGNGIESIAPGAFRNLKSLETLDLSRNGLNSLRKGIFSNTRNLRQIDLSFNRLNHIDGYFFFEPFANRIDAGPDSFIDLNHNILTRIEKDTFAGAGCVRSIRIQHNDLVAVHPEAFELEHLERVHVEGNDLCDAKFKPGATSRPLWFSC
ncbi:leucine-rich repeats and immunoglobulin-like domains protein 3 [Cylas formicarius]|uniref:leucine-rich repeats and immunoglobulin-like domains protein 3 n=1 Tax=Cylas formicarius TaxID=197179 RepID=UPI00295877D3|nr:leucine-rich repeats and immunoglobulin-like domains protein 3 [Cylas formicarius]